MLVIVILLDYRFQMCIRISNTQKPAMNWLWDLLSTGRMMLWKTEVTLQIF